MYFIFSRHKTREAAEEALEQYLAEGIISEGEHPRVTWLPPYYRLSARKGRWAVMFPGA